MEVAPSPKLQNHEFGPFIDKSVKETVPLHVTESLTLNWVLGAIWGKVQDQLASNPLPLTAWSAWRYTVIAPPEDIIVPGLPVKALQYWPKEGAEVSAPSKISR